MSCQPHHRVREAVQGNLADGKQVWKNSLKFRLPSSPIMTADNRLLVPLFDSDVKAWTVNPSNGNTDKALSIKK